MCPCQFESTEDSWGWLLCSAKAVLLHSPTQLSCAVTWLCLSYFCGKRAIKSFHFFKWTVRNHIAQNRLIKTLKKKPFSANCKWIRFAYYVVSMFIFSCQWSYKRFEMLWIGMSIQAIIIGVLPSVPAWFNLSSCSYLVCSSREKKGQDLGCLHPLTAAFWQPHATRYPWCWVNAPWWAVLLEMSGS